MSLSFLEVRSSRSDQGGVGQFCRTSLSEEHRNSGCHTPARCPQPTCHPPTQLPDQPWSGLRFLVGRLLWRSLPCLCEAWVTLTPRKGAHVLPQNRDPRGCTTEETRWEKAVTSGDPYRGRGSTLPVPHTMATTEPFYCFKGFSIQFSIVHLHTLRYMNLDQLLNLWGKKKGSWDYNRYCVESVDEFGGYWHFNIKSPDSKSWDVYLLQFLSTWFYSFRV